MNPKRNNPQDGFPETVSRSRALISLLFALTLIGSGNIYYFQNSGSAADWPIAGGASLLVFFVYILFVFRPRVPNLLVRDFTRPPLEQAELDSSGLGPLPDSATGASLYLDLMKRVVTNIIYEDPPFWFYNHEKNPLLAHRYSLERRVLGEDLPSQAHTMVGLRRIENVQYCMEDIIKRGVPGDFIETGSYCGGVTIFMRAVLRAHEIRDRRVIACDTFVPPEPLPTGALLHIGVPLFKALATIPGKKWARTLYPLAMKIMGLDQKFPIEKEVRDDFIAFMFWAIRNIDAMLPDKKAGLDYVKSNFARYGLLDDQVVFLRGFFQESLARLESEKLALIRLDADAYKSTRDSLDILYERLSPGGYCIIDDYNSFAECKAAADDFRAEKSIQDEIIKIDNLAVYWQKSA